MSKVYLSLGGNVGDKRANFKEAEKQVGQMLGKIIQRSSVYETPPWGFHSDDNFWNRVLLIETDKRPETLLSKIHEIENMFGRERKSGKYLSRKIDIDILYYDDFFIETADLIIPHPLIQQRKFVLVPLAEIAPDFRHPLLRLTTIGMLDNCRDESVVKKIEFD